MDTANTKRSNESNRGEPGDDIYEPALSVKSDVLTASAENANDTQRYDISNADAKTLCIFEENSETTALNYGANTPSTCSNNVDDFDFDSVVSSGPSVATGKAASITKIPLVRSFHETNDYVNVIDGKSYLQVEFKSAIYSRGQTSIWVKMTYKIYEKTSEKDWIGLYAVGESCTDYNVV